MKYRPYISLDIETTGLDLERSQILQLAAVLDTGTGTLEDLESINFLIQNPVITYGEPYAMGLNSWILEALQPGYNGGIVIPKADLGRAMMGLRSLLRKGINEAIKYDKKTGREPQKKIQLAGKNLASFDLPIIKHQAAINAAYSIDGLVQQRVIDMGPLYFPEFGYIPSMGEINQLISPGSTVTHNALEDALDVVKAIRHKLNPMNQNKPCKCKRKCHR